MNARITSEVFETDELAAIVATYTRVDQVLRDAGFVLVSGSPEVSSSCYYQLPGRDWRHGSVPTLRVSNHPATLRGQRPAAEVRVVPNPTRNSSWQLEPGAVEADVRRVVGAQISEFLAQTEPAEDEA